MHQALCQGHGHEQIKYWPLHSWSRQGRQTLRKYKKYLIAILLKAQKNKKRNQSQRKFRRMKREVIPSSGIEFHSFPGTSTVMTTCACGSSPHALWSCNSQGTLGHLQDGHRGTPNILHQFVLSAIYKLFYEESSLPRRVETTVFLLITLYILITSCPDIPSIHLLLTVTQSCLFIPNGKNAALYVGPHTWTLKRLEKSHPPSQLCAT